jgi:hypothetical protein
VHVVVIVTKWVPVPSACLGTLEGRNRATILLKKQVEEKPGRSLVAPPDSDYFLRL